MKLLPLLAIMLVSTKGFSQSKFDLLQVAADTTYGYSASNPLRLKKGDQLRSITNSEEFLSGLQTLDGQKLLLRSRVSIDDPAYKDSKIKLTDRYTGMPLNGKLGILDRYTFVTSITKDTIRLYVDIYNKSTPRIPVRLKYVH